MKLEDKIMKLSEYETDKFEDQDMIRSALNFINFYKTTDRTKANRIADKTIERLMIWLN